MHDGFSFEIVVRFTARIFNEHDRDEVVFGIDRKLHHVALDLFALPNAPARQDIDSFEPRLAAEIPREQNEVGVWHGRHGGLIYPASVTTPDSFARFAVDGVEALFSSGEDDAEIGRLIKPNFGIEICVPDRLSGSDCRKKAQNAQK